MEINDITRQIIVSSIKVHSILGAGLMETIYEKVLAYELRKAGLDVKQQVAIPVKYENILMEIGFRVDLLVEESVIVEIKSVESVHPLHKKQVLTYLKLTNNRIGLLINFNQELLKNGITRLFNKHVK